MRNSLLMLWLCLSAGCRSAPPLHEVLAPVDAVRAEFGTLQERCDAEAFAAREVAEARPDDAAAQVSAARWLATAADVRLIESQVARAAAEKLTVQQLVELDETGDADLKDAVLGLCSAGLEHGNAAADLAPEDPAALYYRAFNLSLVAWAEGKSTAILRGRGPKLKAALESVAERFPEFQFAGPLRLRARFLDRAPWPYGDRNQAIELLQEATRLAPTPVNWQFLGDALWMNGAEEKALAAWKAGAVAEADPSIDLGADLRRQLNRARVDAWSAAR
ncbi:hypothetical protein Poly30_13030 [Planctomycetes bacterium Poly30]|uniref:Tetratricopeptide repeat protein n=1 Tax=Saltatorellus ferox TaxID=2528018 RepID=A0A518ENY5_9BACT|nr:hypothetical protein Poly30_13030 [Planctomycetes bacterium Poly30]